MPSESSGNFDDPEVQGPPLDTLRPIEITQPEGRSSRSRATGCAWGRAGTCGSASTRARVLTLHQVAFDGRPASSTGRRSPRWWCRTPTRRPCGSGRTTSTPASTCSPARQLAGAGLRLPRRHRLLRRRHRRRPRRAARPSRTPSACTRRTTASSGSTPTSSPAPRRPAASAAWSSPSSRTVGNYDYGFYWYLYLDGTIQLEVQGHRHRVHLGLPGGTDRTRRRSRPGSARRSTSTCSRRGWT